MRLSMVTILCHCQCDSESVSISQDNTVWMRNYLCWSVSSVRGDKVYSRSDFIGDRTDDMVCLVHGDGCLLDRNGLCSMNEWMNALCYEQRFWNFEEYECMISKAEHDNVKPDMMFADIT